MKKKSFPNMRSAVMAWAIPTKIFIVCKKQVDFKTEEYLVEKNIKLVRVPSGQDLEMKKEGQRKWNDETIYSSTDLDLKVDDMIIFECISGSKFRIMNKINFNDFGFIQYDLTSTFL